MKRVNFWGLVEKTQTCWLWRGYLHPLGYGYTTFQGKHWRVHRLSYTLARGGIPKGLVIDHLCRVRNCVNPDHLEAVTQLVNVLRGDTLQAHNLAKTSCPKGHPYDSENGRFRPDGSRRCAQCARDAMRARYQSNPVFYAAQRKSNRLKEKV